MKHSKEVEDIIDAVFDRIEKSKMLVFDDYGMVENNIIEYIYYKDMRDPQEIFYSLHLDQVPTYYIGNA